MSDSALQAYALLSREMGRLRTQWRFDVPDWAAAAAGRLALENIADALPPLVGVVGGASSGKSTVFNNLLEGHQPSCVTAKGHATLGPILAVHERHRTALSSRLHDGVLLPGYPAMEIELEAAVPGDPRALSLAYHVMDASANVLLFDMPDFTSEAARREGDVTMSLLPWFDAILVVIDHERWFDRQSISHLRTESTRYGQRRMVIFNRTAEGELQPADRQALEEQSKQLASEAMMILEFRRGRGFCRFPPGTLDAVSKFLQQPRPDRRAVLRTALSGAAEHVLNQNTERAARRDALEESLRAAARRRLPTREQCMTALMTKEERRNLDAASRVLRLRETSDWLAEQSRRLQSLFKQVPVIGSWMAGDGDRMPDHAPHDRLQVARDFQETFVQRLSAEIRQLERASAFWEEMRRWAKLEPSERQIPPISGSDMEAAARGFDAAMSVWTEKVERECAGLSPHIKGALGVGTVGLALILIAAPGPLAALTVVAAKGAVAGALSHLLMASGAGALLGKHLSRFTAVVQEKLLGSAELAAVRKAAESVRQVLISTAGQLVAPALSDADAFVIKSDEPLLQALERAHRG